jgi:hypothetical protein
MKTDLDQVGLASLNWFLASHRDELPLALRNVLHGYEKELLPTMEALIDALVVIGESGVETLCSDIKNVHREYFGTMNGRELVRFIHDVSVECRLREPSGQV